MWGTMRSVTVARHGWPSGPTATWSQLKETTGRFWRRRATTVPLAHKERKDRLELRAHKVRKEQPGRKERPGQQVLKVHREQLDHKALRVRPEQTDLLAPKGRKERR